VVSLWCCQLDPLVLSAEELEELEATLDKVGD
jgi:hypothetical protein